VGTAVRKINPTSRGRKWRCPWRGPARNTWWIPYRSSGRWFIDDRFSSGGHGNLPKCGSSRPRQPVVQYSTNVVPRYKLRTVCVGSADTEYLGRNAIWTYHMGLLAYLGTDNEKVTAFGPQVCRHAVSESDHNKYYNRICPRETRINWLCLVGIQPSMRALPKKSLYGPACVSCTSASTGITLSAVRGSLK